MTSTSAPAQSVVAPVHDKRMAARYLAGLDPVSDRFTFQFFADCGDGKPEIFHGTLEDVWPKITACNTAEGGHGVFITVNETDFKGRRTDNIVRARALFVDADGESQMQRCEEAVKRCDATPSMVVQSSAGRAHYYWVSDDIPLENFCALQEVLIQKLGTDPAIKDLPRVMRLPGTLHLKDRANPQFVRVWTPTECKRWKIADLVAKLELQAILPKVSRTQHRPHSSGPLMPADSERLRRIFGIDQLAARNELVAGIRSNVEKIRSAVDAISPSAISEETDWMKFARAFAHTARVFPDQAEDLWKILDHKSRQAPGYNETDNRERWERYIGEAHDRDAPITIATVFDLAKKHGWPGWSPSIVASADDVDPLNFTRTTEADAVARVNREFFFRRDTCEICRRDDATGEIQVLSLQQLKTTLAGRWVSNALDPRTGRAKVRPASEVWLESRDRKEVHGIQYCPNNVGLRRDNLNLWRGWGVEAASGDCSIVLDHILHIIAAGNERKAMFVLDWCADIVQNPTRKPGVALVLGGREGTGKSVLGAILRRLLGSVNVLVNADKDRLLGRFNSALAGKILIQAEEAFFAGDSKTADALKHLITGNTLQIEIKFGSSFEIDSFHRLLITSNHTQVIQASSEARRFVVCEVSDARKGDPDYFDRLYAVADGRDEATARALMHNLLNRDLSNFRPWAVQQEFLGDKALIRQKLLSLSPPLAWLWEALESVDREQENSGWHIASGGLPADGKWPRSFRRSAAVYAFRDWVTTARPHGANAYTGSEQKFWSEIHRVIPRRLTTVKDASGNRCVDISLSEARANFKRYMRGKPNE